MLLAREFISWVFYTFWPIWAALIIFFVHKLILLPCLGGYIGYVSLCTEEAGINEIYAALIQIIGALLVLYSIDSNLGLLKKSSLYSLFFDALKKCPLLKQTTIARANVTINWKLGGNVKARGYSEPKSVEDHLELLHKQVSWLNEDMQDQKLEFTAQLHAMEGNHSEESSAIKKEVVDLEQKIVCSAIGSLKPQVLGIILVCYGAYLNVA